MMRDDWGCPTYTILLKLFVCVRAQVMWTPDEDRGVVRREAPGLLQTSMEKLPPSDLQRKGISRLLLRYNQASARDIRWAAHTQSNHSPHTCGVH